MSIITIEKFAVEYERQATAEEKKAAAIVAGAGRAVMAELSKAYNNNIGEVVFNVGALTKYAGNTAQIAKLLHADLVALNFDASLVSNGGLRVDNVLDSTVLKAIASGEWNKENVSPQQQ